MNPRNIIRHLKSRVAKTLVLISILGIGSTVLIRSKISSDMSDFYRTGGISWGYDFSNPTHGGSYDNWASHDLVMTQTRDLWQTSRSQTSIGYIDSVRVRNPDSIFLAYFSFDNVYHFQKMAYENSDDILAGIDPENFEVELNSIVPMGIGNSDYDTWKLFIDNPTWLARTDTDDPATSEPDTFAVQNRNYLFNITIKEARESFADLLIRDYYASTDVAYKPGIGLLLDFPTISIPDYKIVGSGYDLEEYGKLDLDQDGVPYDSDTGEKAEWVAATIEYLKYLRQNLPAGTLLIGNSTDADSYLPYTELLDGVMYEHFPRYHFGSPYNSSNYNGVLQYSRSTSLFGAQRNSWVTENGGPYLIVENAYDEDEVAIVSALFDNTYCVWLTESDVRSYSDSRLDLSFLGAPIDTTTVSVFNDWNEYISRDFENGIIRVKRSLIVGEENLAPYSVYNSQDEIVYSSGDMDPSLPPDAPICRIEPSSLEFYSSELGGSDTKSITVTNIGTGILSVYLITQNSEYFHIDGDALYPPYGITPIDLESMESCEIEITYTCLNYSEDESDTVIDYTDNLPPFIIVNGEGCESTVSLHATSAESPTADIDWTFTDNWNGPTSDYMSMMTQDLDFPKVTPNDYWFNHQIGTDQDAPYFDPDHQRQWWLDENHMNAERAWAVATGDSSTGVLSAIVDAYPNSMHNDFKQRLFWNSNEAPGGINGGTVDVDDDENGYVDDYYGWNWGVSSAIPQRNKPWFGNEDIISLETWTTFSDNSGDNDNLHGSSMLGIFAASTNNESWWLVDPAAPPSELNDSGIAPLRGTRNAGLASLSWNTKVMPCTFGYFSIDGGTWYSPNSITSADALASSLEYITDLKVNGGYDFRVVSYSTSPFNTRLQNAIISATLAGILVVGGSGNSNTGDVLDLAEMNETLGVTCLDYLNVRLNKGTGSTPGSNWGTSLDAAGYGSDGTNTINWGTFHPPYTYSEWNPITRDKMATFGAIQFGYNGDNLLFPAFDQIGNDSTFVANEYVYSGITTTDGLTSGATAMAAGLATLVAAASEECGWNGGEPLTPQQIKYMIKRGSLNVDDLNEGNCGGADCDGLLGKGRMDAYTTLTLWGTVPRDTVLTGDVYVSGDILIPSGVSVQCSPGTTLHIALDNILENVSGYDTIRLTLVDITISGTGVLDLRGSIGNPVTITSWVSPEQSYNSGDWGKIIGTYMFNSNTVIEGNTP